MPPPVRSRHAWRGVAKGTRRAGITQEELSFRAELHRTYISHGRLRLSARGPRRETAGLARQPPRCLRALLLCFSCTRTAGCGSWGRVAGTAKEGLEEQAGRLSAWSES